MAPQFYPLRIRNVVKTTADCSVLEFEVPDALKETFRFHQGQHLTLRTQLSGQEIRRSYSLCSSPLDGEWKVAVKQIEGGVFSGFANQKLKAGDTLEVMNPHGTFYVEADPGARRHYVAFAAGSGITPVFSILKTHLLAEPEARCTLFYSSQNVSSIILKEEIEGLKNRFLDRFEVHFFLTQEDRDIGFFNGRLSPEKLETISRFLLDLPSVDHFFLCGPEELIFMIKKELELKGVEENRIHFELFTTLAGQKRARKTEKAPSNLAGNTEVQLREGGKTIRFRMARDHETVLDAALRYHGGLPFACKGGVCCTCKAKLLEGKVEMDVHYALEKEQLDAGYILTCQATPLTERISVDFDQ